jgi:hypothetical protein
VAFGSPDWNGGQVTIWEESTGNTMWTTLGQSLSGAVGENGRFGYAVALSSDGNVVTIGSPFAVTSGQEAVGVVRIFAETPANSTWVQRGHDLVGEGEFELNGWSVALSANGSRVVLGSPGSGIGSFTGAVRAFEFNGTAWTPLGQTINGDSIEDKFGHSVSLSEDGMVLAVGGWEKPGPGNSITLAMFVSTSIRRMIGCSWVETWLGPSLTTTLAIPCLSRQVGCKWPSEALAAIPFPVVSRHVVPSASMSLTVPCGKGNKG